MPRRENTSATPSDTTSSSPPRMRGATSSRRHPGAERREDRGELATGRGRADDHDRRGQALHRPDVAVGYGVFGAGEVHPPRVAAGADDELLARDAGAVPERERVPVHEPGVAGPVHDARARRSRVAFVVAFSPGSRTRCAASGSGAGRNRRRAGCRRARSRRTAPRRAPGARPWPGRGSGRSRRWCKSRPCSRVRPARPSRPARGRAGPPSPRRTAPDHDDLKHRLDPLSSRSMSSGGATTARRARAASSPGPPRPALPPAGPGPSPRAVWRRTRRASSARRTSSGRTAIYKALGAAPQRVEEGGDGERRGHDCQLRLVAGERAESSCKAATLPK